MKNKIVKPNPYGALVIDELLAFEKILGVMLPKDYREYLIDYNGAEFENETFDITGKENQNSSIHLLYALVNEPEWASLQKVNKFFDGVDLKKEGYLSIGTDPLGNQILLKLNKKEFGSIYYWDHELPFSDIRTILLKQATSFTEFILRLRKAETQEEFLARLKKENPEEYQAIIEILRV